MEELQPQDIDELLRELEEGSGAEESLPQEVEELLRVLQSTSRHLDRHDAAVQLGHVETSSPRIVRALIAAYESDPYSMVNWAAARSLRAPVHQEYFQQHPDLMEAAEKALQKRPGADRQQPRSRPSSGPSELEASLKLAVWAGDIEHPIGLVALAAGVILGILGLARKLVGGAEKGTVPSDLEAPLKTHGRRGVTGQKTGSLIRCMAWSSVAGLAVGLVLGWCAAQLYDATVCWALLLVPLTVGAVVGAVVQGRKDRIAGIATGVAFTAAVAYLSGFVIFLWQIITMGGP